jgi:hypothetical protein
MMTENWQFCGQKLHPPENFFFQLKLNCQEKTLGAGKNLRILKLIFV